MTGIIESAPRSMDTQQFAQQLVEQAHAEGVDLLGPNGLLRELTKTVA